MTPCTVERQRDVIKISVPMKRSSTWEQRFLLTADRHHDNAHSDHRMQKRHLDEAMERGAGVLDFGDLYCAMQGKWDKRADQNALRPEHRGNNYLDLIRASVSGFLAPYAENILVLTPGNHETAILRHHQTDLTETTVDRLRQAGSPVLKGNFTGFVRFMLKDGTHSESVILYYHHGHGGGGPVTKGVIQSNRRAASIDADIFVTGHIHEHWNLANVKKGVTEQGAIYQREELHVQIPSYKNESTGDGYHEERGRPCKPIGAVWLVFRYDAARGCTVYDVERAR